MQFSPATAARLQREGWRVAVTGASGWMGQALLEMLQHGRVPYAAFTSTERTITLRDGTPIPSAPLSELRALPPATWLVAHCAYGTKDRVSTQGQDHFVQANASLTDAVSEALRTIKPNAIFFPSSGAVYAKDGTLDSDLAKNPYGVQKHQDEAHFTALAAQLGARICIPRLFNMAGPYINKWHAYALADLIVQVQDGKPLSIQSPGPVTRSYVHVRDVLELSFAALLESTQPSPIAFDTRGDADIEIAQLGESIERTLLGNVRSTLRVADAHTAGSYYIGKAEPMRTLCARYGLSLISLAQQITDTAGYIAQQRQHEQHA